jgi:PAS domain-containing protein
MRSPAIRVVTSKAALSSTGPFPRAGIKLSAGATEPLLNTNERQRFYRTLATAEEEARSIHAGWSVAKSEQQPREFDTESFLDIVKFRGPKLPDGNAMNVQRFNEELEASEEEAHSIHTGQSAINVEQQQAHKIDPQQVLDLLTSIVEVVREPLVILDNALCIRKANRAFYRTFNYLEENTEDRFIYDLAQGSWNIPALKILLEKVRLDNRAYEEVEIEVESPQVVRKTLRLNVRRLSGGEMILMSIRDVAPRRRTEVELHRVQDELRQGQKMEVVGRLAGGVAHDFNNILTGILGFSELILDSLEKKTDVFRHATEIKRASERASALTQY